MVLMRWMSRLMCGALVSVGATGAAVATPCYVILDRSDAVIYRDVVPPFDLSDPKSPDRTALRARGEHLLVAEFDKCEPAGYISPTTGGTTASVDDIVNQLRPAIAPSVGTRQGVVKGAASAGTATTPAAAAPARTTTRY